MPIKQQPTTDDRNFGILEVLARTVGDSPTIAPIDLVLELPSPPSINRTIGTRLGSQHRLVKQWMRAADAHLLMTKQSKRLRRLEGIISIDIIWDIQDLADIDNRIKYLLDYLQLIGVVSNDNKIRSMHLDYGVVCVAPAGCRIKIAIIDGISLWQAGRQR